MLDIGAKIRTSREQKGLSRKAFGDLVGISEAKVQAIEIGKQRVDHETLANIVQAMELDIAWLLSLKVLPTFHASNLKDIGLDPERLRMAIEAIEEGLDAVGRSATPDVKAALITAAYELFEQEGAKATAQIIRLVKSV